MISVIDMPHAEESMWWRGKRGFDVGFFPCECVEVIGPGNVKADAAKLTQAGAAAAAAGQQGTATLKIFPSSTMVRERVDLATYLLLQQHENHFGC